MLKVSDAVFDIIRNNPLLELGISQKLMNLTQVAKYILPLIKTRTKKPIATQAVVMALSRLQKKLHQVSNTTQPLFIESISSRSDLWEGTYSKSARVLQQLSAAYELAEKQKAFFTCIEGQSEITIITEQRITSALEKLLSETPLTSTSGIAAVSIKFHRSYLNTPGMFYFVIQQITLQNLNILEINSTGSEFSIFVLQQDAKLAFNTLSELFQQTY